MVELRFDGVRYSYWQQVEIRESVDDLCAAVRLAIALPGTGDALGLTANTVVQVLVDGHLVATVRPDSVQRQVDAGNHSIQFEARSLGRELVDCQHSATIKGLKLGEVVKRICAAFKVPVKLAVDTAVVPDFSMQCELPANALINAVRAADLLLYPQPDGGLILTGPTSTAPVATLEYGVNIKRYAVVDEFKLRHSAYTVKGYDHEANASVKGYAADPGITFFRPMHIVADRHGKGVGGCDRRARLERNRRLARSHRLDLDVVGWRHAGGVWAINTQVRVIIPQEGIDGVFLIGERSFLLDDQGGSLTHLQVMHREAFIGEEPKKTKHGAGVKK